MQSTSSSDARGVAGHRTQVRKFGVWNRLNHGVLAMSVFGLVFTGMPLRYPTAFWAHGLMRFWGGPHTAGIIHRAFAAGLFAAGVMHLGAIIVLAVRRKLGPIFGPDSILPRPDDARHLIGYLRFLVGRGPRPDFGKFTYWEKFDYLAEVWGLFIIGGTGLAMWFPEVASRYLPGWIVNAALIVHSNEALLATGFLFAIHFFNTHLLPEAFPLNTSIFSGGVALEEVREERPGWYRRLLASGTLPQLSVHESRTGPAAALVAGVIFLSLGVVMLTLVMSSAIAEGGKNLISLFH